MTAENRANASKDFLSEDGIKFLRKKCDRMLKS